MIGSEYVKRQKKILHIKIYFIIEVGKAPDTLARVPEMMDTPPILWFSEILGVAYGSTLFIAY